MSAAIVDAGQCGDPFVVLLLARKLIHWMPKLVLVAGRGAVEIVRQREHGDADQLVAAAVLTIVADQRPANTTTALRV